MARAVVYFRFADGELIQVIAEGKHSYPDALHELMHEAVEGFKDAMTAALAIETAHAKPGSDDTPA